MTINIKKIIEAVLDYRFWITDHADEEAEEDQLSFDEIYHSVLYGEIIEEYPHNQPFPRCLIYGENFATEPIHSVWDYDQETDILCIDPIRKDGLMEKSGDTHEKTQKVS
ncbi:MAG: DUF4258 domain-containing protein [Crocosphaera sp.]